MEIKAYMKKNYLYIFTISSVILLAISILLVNMTLILSSVLIMIVSFWMFYVYVKYPALHITEEELVFRGLLGTTTYLLKEMHDIKYANDTLHKIEFLYKENTTLVFIQNSYNVSVEDIMEGLQYNKTIGD